MQKQAALDKATQPKHPIILSDLLAESPRNPHIFEVSEKILIRETGKQITATYDNEQHYILSSLY
jgi:hypothetical protein